jgi:hypothetical protein
MSSQQWLLVISGGAMDVQINAVGYNVNEELKSKLINTAYTLLNNYTSYHSFKIDAISVVPVKTDREDGTIETICIMYYFSVLNADMSLKYERVLVCYMDIDAEKIQPVDIFQVVNGRVLPLHRKPRQDNMLFEDE